MKKQKDYGSSQLLVNFFSCHGFDGTLHIYLMMSIGCNGEEWQFAIMLDIGPTKETVIFVFQTLW